MAFYSRMPISPTRNAVIDGNKFSGQTNETTVNGAFYGDNAKDIAGHYTNPTENFQGAFGGSQR